MPGDPPCHFYVQLVQPAPAKIAKNLQKIQSFKKIFKKKTKKSFKKLFFHFSKMALFQFRNFNFGICSDKDAFIKEASSSLPILHFYSKTVSMMYPLPSESFHWLSTFQADDWPIRTDFQWFYPRLEKSKATIFLILPFFAKFQMKKLIKQKYSFWTCGIHLQMSFWNVEISQSLFFISCFRVKWVTRFYRG